MKAKFQLIWTVSLVRAMRRVEIDFISYNWKTFVHVLFWNRRLLGAFFPTPAIHLFGRLSRVWPKPRWRMTSSWVKLVSATKTMIPKKVELQIRFFLAPLEIKVFPFFLNYHQKMFRSSGSDETMRNVVALTVLFFFKHFFDSRSVNFCLSDSDQIWHGGLILAIKQHRTS